MADNTPPDDEQAVETVEAANADAIRAKLPADVEAELTGRAFSAGAVVQLLRDCYYLGPISIGTGGWIGAFGKGKPGTGLRRPKGALYNYPRSWRYAAVVRALRTGIIIHVGGGRFATTERGAALLERLDRCPECGCRREPRVKNTRYVGDPNSEGHLQSHELVTRCPECDGMGIDYGSIVSGFEVFERGEKAVEWAREIIADHPDARVFGDGRPVDPAAADREPEIPGGKAEEIATEQVEDATEPTPRAYGETPGEGLYGRQVIVVGGDGAYYRFHGTDEAISVGRTDEKGDVHLVAGEDGRIEIEMSYELAVERGLKDRLHRDAEDAAWNGSNWTVEANAINRVLSKLTVAVGPKGSTLPAGVFPDQEGDVPESAEYLSVTVEQDALDDVTVPVLGVDAE